MFSTNDIAIPVLQLNSQRWATRIRTSSTGLADGEGALWCWSSLRILMVYHQFPYENDHFEVQYPPCHWSFWDGGNIHPRFGMFCWPFSPQAMAPSHGGTARLGKTLYTVHHCTRCNNFSHTQQTYLWIVDNINRPHYPHKTRCSPRNRMQSRQHFCQTSCLNSLVHFSPVTVPVHCRLWYMRKRAECKVWSVKKMECWVWNVVCRVWRGDCAVWSVKCKVWGGKCQV